MFYTSVPYTEENDYWQRCASRVHKVTKKRCSDVNLYYSTFGIIAVNTHIMPEHMRISSIEEKNLRAFSRNDSLEVYTKLLNRSEKVVIVGLNTEIDETLKDLNIKLENDRFFRGKENIWPQIKMWEFPMISYSQARDELVRLMGSGIYQFWKYWNRDRYYILMKLKHKISSESPNTISLSSNAAFVLVILCLGLATSVMFHVAENTYYYYYKYSCQTQVVRFGSGFPSVLLN